MKLCTSKYEVHMQVNNARITFTDSESPSHKEGRVLEHFLQQNGTLHMIEVMIKSSDNGSLLRDEYRKQLWDLIYETSNKISVKLSYPTMDILGRQIFIANNVYGITFVGNTNIIQGFNTVRLILSSNFPHSIILPIPSYFVGIDDVFIMLAAWHRTEKNMEIPRRIAEMVKVSGCSMTVTSITNFISFGNGVLSTTPVLQTFAIYSVVASVVCYLYQLILFPAILTLTAPNEYKKLDDNECRFVFCSLVGFILQYI
uniref:SSD domain-containing protein n=1 Tax=Heterorhabditis bacteriophora TaxID=37862 RepID=A0A1I7XJB9_HETBA